MNLENIDGKGENAGNADCVETAFSPFPKMISTRYATEIIIPFPHNDTF